MSVEHADLHNIEILIMSYYFKKGYTVMWQFLHPQNKLEWPQDKGKFGTRTEMFHDKGHDQ